MVDVVSNPDVLGKITQLNLLLDQALQIISHASLGAVSAHVLEALKNIPVIARVWHAFGDKGKPWVAAAIAFVGSLGITVALSPGAHQGDWTIALTGLTGASIAHHLWGFLQSWAFQSGWYAKVIKEARAVLAQASTITGRDQTIGAPSVATTK